MVVKQSANSVHSNPSQGAAFDPWVLWIAFRKNWAWCVPLGATVTAAAVSFFWLTFTPEYQAFRVLESSPEYVLYPVHQVRDLAGERQFILNSTVLDTVLSDPELSAAPSLSNPLTAEKQLRSRLEVRGGGGYLTISYKDRDPKFAAKVCNAVVESYLKKRESSAETRSTNILAMLEPELSKLKREVEQKRGHMADLMKQNWGFDPFKDNSVVESSSAKLMDLRKMLAALDADTKVLNARLKALNSRDLIPDEPRIDEKEIEQYVGRDDEVRELQFRIVDKQAKLRGIEQKGLQDNSYYSSRSSLLKSEIATAKEELKEVESKVRAKANEALRETGNRRIAEERARLIRLTESEMADLATRREALKADYEKEKTLIDKMGGETVDLAWAKEDYQVTAELKKQLTSRLAILKTEHRAHSGVVSLGVAKPPLWPIEELPYKKMVLAAIVAMLSPLGIAVLHELWAKRLVDAKGLETSTFAPVLGEISQIRPGSQSQRSRRLFDESIDALRANLFFKLESAAIRTIAVTSAMPSEGKSSISSQLAHSLASATGEMVLLIDADIRSPDLYRLFGAEFGPGLTKVLSKEIELNRAIDQIEGLVHLLPAGKLKGNPHNLISHKSMIDLFASIPSHYRYVVIDTAPILPASETLAITAAADATLLCAMRDVSRRDHVLRAQRLLQGAGASLVGTVFSGIPAWDYAYRYGDYRYANRI